MKGRLALKIWALVAVICITFSGCAGPVQPTGSSEDTTSSVASQTTEHTTGEAGGSTGDTSVQTTAQTAGQTGTTAPTRTEEEAKLESIGLTLYQTLSQHFPGGFPEGYAGAYVNPGKGLAVCVTDLKTVSHYKAVLTDQLLAQEISKAFPKATPAQMETYQQQLVTYEQKSYSLKQLEQLKGKVSPATSQFEMGMGINEVDNCIDVAVSDEDLEAFKAYFNQKIPQEDREAFRISGGFQLTELD